MTDETNGVIGTHNADNIDVPNHHFNILEVVRDAKADFEAKNPGKTAAFFYAPEPILYLIDRSVKGHAIKTGTPEEILNQATVTHVLGMELISILGTCVTVTAEAVHTDEPESKEPVAQIIPRDTTPN